MKLIILLTIGLVKCQSIDEEQECYCVPPNLCLDDDVTANGQGLLDVRLENSECPQYFEICCENPVNVTDKWTPPTNNGNFCGYQHLSTMNGRITSNSENSIFGELPWSVVILLRDGKTERNMYLCGGSVIHPQVILTAAHCVHEVDKSHLTVRVGEWNTKSQAEPLPHQDRPVQEISVHPHYHSGSLKNDIALVFLAEPVDLADNVGLICLPHKGMLVDEKNCIASGWGKDAFKKGKHSSILKKVVLPIVPRSKCIGALRTTRLGAYFNLHRSFICAGGEENKDTCKGDGGSPLVCPIVGEEKRFVQVGIVSWGIGCGENETPGVYVNLPIYSDWIDKQFYAKNFDSSVYRL